MRQYYVKALFFSVLLLALLSTDSNAGTDALPPPARISDTASVFTVTVDNDTDLTPGDPVRYSINFTVPIRSISFAWGFVDYAGAGRVRLPLQFKILRRGDHSFYWDRTVPAGAEGEGKVVVTYIGIPGRIARESATFDVGESETPDQEYVGSSRCISCHLGYNRALVDAYMESGHYFALTSISGAAPSYPDFVNGVTTAPPGTSWDDIAYAIGGYAWSTNFASSDNGTILNGPESQYILASDYLGTSADYVSYEPDVADPGSFDCGACHATGYVEGTPQDGLTAITGNWTEDGVGCEACHGPGSAHASSPATFQPGGNPPASCGSCHVRDNETVIEAAGGLILHNQQSEELRATNKSFMTCTTCHDAHASARYDADAAGTAIIKDCTECHAGKTVGLNMENLACIECHMPYAVLAGASRSFSDGNSESFLLGDVRSHIFKIDTDAATPADMFDDNGTRLALDSGGKTAGLTVNLVCSKCHPSYTYDSLKGAAKSIHPPQ